MNRLTVAELKQLVERPDVVEMHDVTAQDPRLLVYLKVGYILYTVPLVQIPGNSQNYNLGLKSFF